MNIPGKLSLAGQRALITGGNRGYGPIVAEALAKAGAQVMINYWGERDKAQQVAETIRANHGQAMIFQADVSKENQVRSLFDVMIAYWGSIDILVNNIDIADSETLVNMTLEQWPNLINGSLTGQFLCVREAAREFLRRGAHPQSLNVVGKIICMTTLPSEVSWLENDNYTASIGGAALLTKLLAQELCKDNIRVNGIVPNTPKSSANGSHDSIPERQREWSTPIFIGSIVESKDIANTVIWLASDEPNVVNGATFYIEKGCLLHSGVVSS